MVFLNFLVVFLFFWIKLNTNNNNNKPLFVCLFVCLFVFSALFKEGKKKDFVSFFFYSLSQD